MCMIGRGRGSSKRREGRRHRETGWNVDRVESQSHNIPFRAVETQSRHPTSAKYINTPMLPPTPATLNTAYFQGELMNQDVRLFADSGPATVYLVFTTSCGGGGGCVCVCILGVVCVCVCPGVCVCVCVLGCVCVCVCVRSL